MLAVQRLLMVDNDREFATGLPMEPLCSDRSSDVPDELVLLDQRCVRTAAMHSNERVDLRQ